MRKLPTIALKWSAFARDTATNREQVRIFLRNMERLQVALGQLNELTIDLADPLSSGAPFEEISEEMDQMVAGFKKVQTHMKYSKLSAAAHGSIGTETTRVSHSFDPLLVGPCVTLSSNRRKATKARDISGHEFSSAVGKLQMTTGGHAITVRIAAKNKTWLLFGVLDPCQSQQFSDSAAPYENPSFFGFSRWAQTDTQNAMGSHAVTFGDIALVRVTVDCDAKTFVASVGSSTICCLGNIPVPCVFGWNLDGAGGSLKFVDEQ